MSRMRRTAMDAASMPVASDMAVVSATSVAACCAPLKSDGSTLLSSSAMFTIGRGVGVGAPGSAGRKLAV